MSYLQEICFTVCARACAGSRRSSLAMLLFILLGLAWTRLPDKHVWQVLLSLLVATAAGHRGALAASRNHAQLAGDDGKARQAGLGRGDAAGLDRRGLGRLGAAGLVRRPDSAVGGLSELAGSGTLAGEALHLRAHSSAGSPCSSGSFAGSWCRPRLFRTPASAQWGWRLPLRQGDPALVELALVAGRGRCARWCVWLPGRFFAADPHGTVSAQIWHVSLKLAATYLLAVGSWVLLLAWEAVLFGRQNPRPDETLALSIGLTEPHRDEGTVEPPLPELSTRSAERPCVATPAPVRGHTVEKLLRVPPAAGARPPTGFARCVSQLSVN